MIKIRRVYEPAEKGEGWRVLVDRLWPRGLKKEEVKFDQWLKEIAPSEGLRQWFAHDPGKWEEFKNRYFQELKKNEGLVETIRVKAREGTVTLLFGAKDTELNNAVALKEFLEDHPRKDRQKKSK